MMNKKTVKNIAAHIITLNPSQLELIKENLFGDSPTFRRGIIGGWRIELNQQHQ